MATARDPEELLTPSEAAHVLNVSADTVRVMADKGQLPVLRTVSGRRLFRRLDVEQLAEKRLKDRPGATPLIHAGPSGVTDPGRKGSL